MTTTMEEKRAATADAARSVKEEAKVQASTVVDEAKAQARTVTNEAAQHLNDQARTQLGGLGSTLTAWGSDLQNLSSGQPAPGPAADLLSSASTQLKKFGEDLANRDPKEIVDQVRTFAAQRPGTFILCSIGAGLVAGRLLAGLRDGIKGAEAQEAQTPTATPTTGYGATLGTANDSYGAGQVRDTYGDGLGDLGRGEYR